MPEYIDREKLIRDLIDNRCFYPAIVKNAIENAPTEDVVKVVRCKDCKNIASTEYGGFCCLKNEGVAYNDYCSYGERRE